MYSGKDRTAIKRTGKLVFTHAVLGLMYTAHDRQHTFIDFQNTGVQNEIKQQSDGETNIRRA